LGGISSTHVIDTGASSAVSLQRKTSMAFGGEEAAMRRDRWWRQAMVATGICVLVLATGPAASIAMPGGRSTVPSRAAAGALRVVPAVMACATW